MANRNSIRELVSRREAEIRKLEEDLKVMEDSSKQDIRELRTTSEQRISELYAQIDQQRKLTVKMVDDREASLVNEQKPVKEIILALKRRNDVALASTAPIGNLPNETLGLIFSEFVAMDSSPWKLVQVSERWKQIAFGTPSLWSQIVISYKSWISWYDTFRDGAKTIYYRGSAQLCFSKDEVRNALARSRSCPLDIKVSWSRTAGEDGDRELSQMLALITEAPTSQRIGSLSIQANLAKLAAEWHGYFDGISLPSLHHLHLDIPRIWRRNLFRSISETTQGLRSLVNPGEESGANLSERVWQGITSIKLDYNTTTRLLDDIISKIPHIENLEVIPDYWPSNSTPQTALDLLRVVTLRCRSDDFRRIHWNALDKLIVRDSEQRSWISDHSLPSTTLPMITSFSLTTHRPEEWLFNISMPNLSALYITFESREPNGGIFKRLPPSTFPKVEELKLYLTTAMDDEDKIGLLEALPNVTSVTITIDDREANHGPELFRRLMDYDGVFELCPKLQALQIGDLYRGFYTKKTVLVPLIKRMVTTRAKKGLPLQKMEVFWRKKPVESYT
jgi:hypothetical protein